MENAPGINVRGSAQVDQRILFSDIELKIVPGKTTCLLGASGVGKSTILRLIAGLDTGVQFDGTIAADDEAPLEQRIGYMAQGGELFPWLSVLENVTLGAKFRGEAADEARALQIIDQVGLSDHIAKRPSSLSGGERQRVALARTLMEDRPIGLLDEPFSALDAKTRSEMQELSGSLLSGRTVLLVTHDPAEAARLGHFVYVLSPNGLQSVDVPSASPVRNFDDAETLSCQGLLYRLLRNES